MMDQEQKANSTKFYIKGTPVEEPKRINVYEELMKIDSELRFEWDGEVFMFQHPVTNVESKVKSLKNDKWATAI